MLPVGLRLHGLRGLGDLYETWTVCSLRIHRMVAIVLRAGVAGDSSRVPRHGFGAITSWVDAPLTVLGVFAEDDCGLLVVRADVSPLAGQFISTHND